MAIKEFDDGYDEMEDEEPIESSGDFDLSDEDYEDFDDFEGNELDFN